MLNVLAGKLQVVQNGFTQKVLAGEVILLVCYHQHAYMPDGVVEFVLAHMDGPQIEPIMRTIEK